MIATYPAIFRLTVLGFNDMSTLVSHFGPPREREKSDKRVEMKENKSRV